MRKWIAVSAPAEAIGWLFFVGAFFSDDAGFDTSMAAAGAVLILAPLPYIAIRIGCGTLWRDMRRFPLSLAIAILGWIAGGLLACPAIGDPEGGNAAMASVGVVVICATHAWLAGRIVALRWRRRRVRKMLHTALGTAPSDDVFTHVPFFVAGERIYYAVEDRLASQDVAGLVWAYGEFFAGWFLCQLVLVNREARAVVLPLWRDDVPQAYRELRAAAPWIATGFNRALLDSWNFDHREFLALIERHRETRTAFAAPWAADAASLVAVAPRGNSDDRIDGGRSRRKERAAIDTALSQWAAQALTRP